MNYDDHEREQWTSPYRLCAFSSNPDWLSYLVSLSPYHVILNFSQDEDEEDRSRGSSSRGGTHHRGRGVGGGAGGFGSGAMPIRSGVGLSWGGGDPGTFIGSLGASRPMQVAMIL